MFRVVEISMYRRDRYAFTREQQGPLVGKIKLDTKEGTELTLSLTEEQAEAVARIVADGVESTASAIAQTLRGHLLDGHALEVKP